MLSIITPVYKTGHYLSSLYQGLKSALDVLGVNYEIIFVIDRINDADLKAALHLQENDANIIAIQHAANYGQHAAIRTGLRHAHGDYLFIIDSDEQEDPAWLIEFWSVMQSENADAVLGVQHGRSGSMVERFLTSFFYGMLKRCSTRTHYPNIVACCLMNRVYTDALLQYTEHFLTLSTAHELLGFQKSFVPVCKKVKSTSGYSVRKKLTLALDYLVHATNLPGYAMLMSGFAMILAGIILLFAGKIILFSIWTAAGCVMTGIGFIAVHLRQILPDIRKRPVAIVKAVYAKEET